MSIESDRRPLQPLYRRAPSITPANTPTFSPMTQTPSQIFTSLKNKDILVPSGTKGQVQINPNKPLSSISQSDIDQMNHALGFKITPEIIKKDSDQRDLSNRGIIKIEGDTITLNQSQIASLTPSDIQELNNIGFSITNQDVKNYNSAKNQPQLITTNSTKFSNTKVSGTTKFTPEEIAAQNAIFAAAASPSGYKLPAGSKPVTINGKTYYAGDTVRLSTEQYNQAVAQQNTNLAAIQTIINTLESRGTIQTVVGGRAGELRNQYKLNVPVAQLSTFDINLLNKVGFNITPELIKQSQAIQNLSSKGIINISDNKVTLSSSSNLSKTDIAQLKLLGIEIIAPMGSAFGESSAWFDPATGKFTEQQIGYDSHGNPVYAKLEPGNQLSPAESRAILGMTMVTTAALTVTNPFLGAVAAAFAGAGNIGSFVVSGRTLTPEQTIYAAATGIATVTSLADTYGKLANWNQIKPTWIKPGDPGYDIGLQATKLGATPKDIGVLARRTGMTLQPSPYGTFNVFNEMAYKPVIGAPIFMKEQSPLTGREVILGFVDTGRFDVNGKPIYDKIAVDPKLSNLILKLDKPRVIADQEVKAAIQSISTLTDTDIENLAKPDIKPDNTNTPTLNNTDILHGMQTFDLQNMSPQQIINRIIDNMGSGALKVDYDTALRKLIEAKALSNAVRAGMTKKIVVDLVGEVGYQTLIDKGYQPSLMTANQVGILALTELGYGSKWAPFIEELNKGTLAYKKLGIDVTDKSAQLPPQTSELLSSLKRLGLDSKDAALLTSKILLQQIEEMWTLYPTLNPKEAYGLMRAFMRGTLEQLNYDANEVKTIMSWIGKQKTAQTQELLDRMFNDPHGIKRDDVLNVLNRFEDVRFFPGRTQHVEFIGVVDPTDIQSKVPYEVSKLFKDLRALGLSEDEAARMMTEILTTPPATFVKSINQFRTQGEMQWWWTPEHEQQILDLSLKYNPTGETSSVSMLQSAGLDAKQVDMVLKASALSQGNPEAFVKALGEADTKATTKILQLISQDEWASALRYIEVKPLTSIIQNISGALQNSDPMLVAKITSGMDTGMLSSVIGGLSTDAINNVIPNVPSAELTSVIPTISNNSKELSNIFSALTPEQLNSILPKLSAENLTSILPNLDSKAWQNIFQNMTPDEITDVMSQLSTDQIQEIEQQMDQEQLNELLKELNLTDLQQIINPDYKTPPHKNDEESLSSDEDKNSEEYIMYFQVKTLYPSQSSQTFTIRAKSFHGAAQQALQRRTSSRLPRTVRVVRLYNQKT